MHLCEKIVFSNFIFREIIPAIECLFTNQNYKNLIVKAIVEIRSQVAFVIFFLLIRRESIQSDRRSEMKKNKQ